MADILILDTDRQLLRSLENYFNRAGHKTRILSDPQNAVGKIDENKPDIIILDLFLAPHSGIEFLYELRSYPEWEKLPVIITGSLMPDEIKAYQDAFKELGIQSYLPKNSSLEELLTAVESTLQPAAA